MTEEKQRVVILGGGITGLAAAFYLQKEAREKKLPLDVTLIEATHRVGGKIQTVVKNGFIIEKGPDSFIARKKSASVLAKEIGMEDTLVSNTAGKSYVLAHERLHPMPGGSIMGIPTEITPFITTGLFSFAGKMRAAADFVLPRSKQKEDQSLGEFFRRRLGDEVLENLIEPLLSGIYAGDIDRLSLMATFPEFYRVEQKYRSLIIGMKKGRPPQKSKPNPKENKKGMFMTPNTGLQSFVEAIEANLVPGSVLKGHRVDKVHKASKGYRIELRDGEIIAADAVISALPHLALKNVFSDFRFFDVFEDMPATSVATVALAFPIEAIEQDIDGTGFVVSRNADYSITACTWTHRKWSHACPEGKVLLRCFIGKPGDETIVELSDDEIVKTVLDDLNKIMNITMEPEFAIISRWPDAMPQYTVGHKERIETVQKNTKEELPGVFLAGSSFEGLGIPDCIDQGKAAVSEVIDFLEKSRQLCEI